MSVSSCRRYRGEESVRVRRMVRFPSPVVNRSLLSWAGSGDPVHGRVRRQKPTTTMTPAHPRPACWRATPTVRHPVLQPGHAARLPRLPARPAAATRPQQDADRVGRCRADQRCPAPRGPAARARPCCRASTTGQGGLAQRRLAGDHRHPAVTQHGLRDGTLQRRNLAFAPDRPNHRTIIAAHRQPGTTTRPPLPIQASVTPRQQRRGSTRSAPDVSVRNRSHCQPSTVPGEAPASSDDPSTATSR